MMACIRSSFACVTIQPPFFRFALCTVPLFFVINLYIDVAAGNDGNYTAADDKYAFFIDE